MRYIDADALKKAIDFPWLENIRLGKIINDAPTIDAEPVVHCKECKYWQDNQEGHYPNEECPWDKGETPDPDDFCSYGERREP